MSLIRRVLGSLPWRTSKMLPFESAVIDSLQSVVSERTNLLIFHQLQQVRLVQRHANGKEVNLYMTDDVECEEWKFSSPFEAWPIAVIYGADRARTTTFRVSVWIASGRVFSLVFSEAPRFEQKSEFSILSIHLLFDPYADQPLLQLDAENKAQPQSIGIFSNVDVLQVKNFQPALNEHFRERFLLPAKNCIPNDYRDLLIRTNGFEVDDWRILGLPLREVAMEGQNLFVLAESIESTLLCVKDEDFENGVFLLHMEVGSEENLGGSFISALKTVGVDLAKAR